ncbi:MAG: hypothetical protein ACRDOU_32015 [Streptosporangiaceae bacterium]
MELLHHHLRWILPVPELSLVSAVIAYVAGIAAAFRLGATLASFTGGALMLSGVILVRIDESGRYAPI